ncbi:hypothetical protein CDAR_56141 [Caerostris darwini]|uniref:Uncharacterized protein n=1 Tax=Caerostris darwini TaxID=1538125 RepID=A0AAV4RRW2_9ARAC|nr:hypothetical protein CDAR_56141 [Caerostris darwini]
MSAHPTITGEGERHPLYTQSKSIYQHLCNVSGVKRHAPFRGVFSVLFPRPKTNILIELVKDVKKKRVITRLSEKKGGNLRHSPPHISPRSNLNKNQHPR